MFIFNQVPLWYALFFEKFKSIKLIVPLKFFSRDVYSLCCFIHWIIFVFSAFQAEKGKKDNSSSSPTKVGAPRGKRKKSVGSVSKEIASSSIEISQADDLDISDVVD